MRPSFFHQSLLLALLASASGCAAEDSDDPRSGTKAPTGGWDTGSYAAEDDAWTTTHDTASAPEAEASWDGESGAYDGLRPAHPEVLSDPDTDCYAPEGMLHVEFDLENTGMLDFDREPGLRLSVDHDDIRLAEPDQWVPSLAAGERVRMQWWAAVGPMVHEGATLSFTATVSARDCHGDGCPVPHSASVSITLD